jgi:hypothetical protein
LNTHESKVAGLSLLLGLGWDHAQFVQVNRLKTPAVIQVRDRSMKPPDFSSGGFFVMLDDNFRLLGNYPQRKCVSNS